MSAVERVEEPMTPVHGPYRKRRFARWVAVVAWMGLIFYLSSQPRLPLVMPSVFSQFQDVIGHFMVYAVLAVLLWWALRGVGVRHPILWALGTTILYSLTDEFHQSFVPNRHPDVFDLATDLAGAVTALLIVRWVPVRRRTAPPVESDGL
jgi:VanZ family protein